MTARRLTLGVLLAALVFGALPGTTSAKVRQKRYCSPTGDYCTAVIKTQNEIRFQIGSFAFKGNYGLCVEAPDGTTTCKTFQLRQKGPVFQSTVSWSRQFPAHGPGTYRVAWKKFGGKLGPRLAFKPPAALLEAASSADGPGATSAAKRGVRLPCLNAAGTRYKARFKPERCAHFGPGGAFGGGVDLHGLVWSYWGAKVASANGVECGFRAGCTDPVPPCPPNLICAQPCPIVAQAPAPGCSVAIPVSVEAFRKRTRCGRRIYTRLRSTSQFGTTLVKTKACLGAA